MYAYVRTDNMSGTTVAKDLASAKFYNGSVEADIENGNVVTLGAYLDGERELRKATVPAANTKLRDLYLVATPEVVKDKTYYGLGEFINKKGEAIRCYRLTSGDIFSVSKEALAGTPAVGSLVEAQASTKLKVVATATSGSTTVGKIMAIEGDYIVIYIMELLQVMIDAVKGTSPENYTKGQTSEVIRQALIEANGGSNKINIKNFYRGSQVYSLIEELIPTIIDEGFKDEDVIFSLVDYRNIADGDEQEFEIEGNSLFAVADAAAGVKGVRRQRIDESQKVTVKTSMKIARVYEELNRLLAGRISFDTFVDRLAKSFKQQILADAYKAIDAIATNTVGLNADYVVASNVAGAEDKLLELIAHIEAATGKTARLYGTKAALRKVPNAVLSDEAKSDLYNMGYFGKFNGNDMVALRQVHKPGTTKFAMNDNKIFVIAGGDKPVKVVNEGEGLMVEGEATDNQDLTKEYVYGQLMGVGVACSEAMGVFTFSA